MSDLASTWCVPVFKQNILREKSTPYCLIIPVINEGKRIQQQLRDLYSKGLSQIVDVIIADGGSTDSSLDDALLRATGVCALLIKTDPGRLSAQLRMAYAWALLQGYEGIITIDGNGKDSVESIPLFIQALASGVDYALASRFIPEGKSINAPLWRILAIRCIHAPLTSLAAGHWFTDTTQGFRAYSRRYLLDDKVQPFRACFSDYELLAYLAIRATQLGYRAVEIPTTRTYPRQGAIPTKISPIRGSADLLKTLVLTCLGKYHP